MDSPEGKENRKLFHEAVRSLGTKLDSETVSDFIWGLISEEE